MDQGDPAETQIVLIDDLVGTETKDGDGQSIMFSWSGVDYSIDHRKANADKFEKSIVHDEGDS